MEAPLKATNWTRLRGQWVTEGNVARYVGSEPASPVGLIVSDARARNGLIEANIRFVRSERGKIEREARLVFRCHTNTEEYFAAGLGGWGHAYCLHYGRGRAAFTLLTGTGSREVLWDKDEYQLSVHVAGRLAVLSVDGNEVIREILPRELPGDRLGLYSYGDQEVELTNLQVTPGRPRAFVIMKFGEPFDSLYEGTIAPSAQEAGFDVHRADQTLGPGAIPEDIIKSMIDADVVIAEISYIRGHGHNANVFYELGYAHSLAKPTIMLVKARSRVPFDIRHLRYIQYEDSPDGRVQLRSQLCQHLRASIGADS